MAPDQNESNPEVPENLVHSYGKAIIAAVLIALTIRFFIVEAYRIPSQAMKPTLEPGDTIFVSKSVYGMRWPWNDKKFTQGRAPQVGEVVVFSPPDDPQRDYIKRIVAGAGDSVQIKAGKLIVNGVPASFPGQKEAVCGHEKAREHSYEVCWDPPVMEDYGPETVPEGSVFLLGDFRSKEAFETPRYTKKIRNWGMIPLSVIKSRALWVWLSIEPRGAGGTWFSRIRFERMFEKIK